MVASMACCWNLRQTCARPTPAPHHQLETPSSYVHIYCPHTGQEEERAEEEGRTPAAHESLLDYASTHIYTSQAKKPAAKKSKPAAKPAAKKSSSMAAAAPKSKTKQAAAAAPAPAPAKKM